MGYRAARLIHFYIFLLVYGCLAQLPLTFGLSGGLFTVMGCASQQQKSLTAEIKGALDMTALAVDPLYEYAKDACAVRDTQITDALTNAQDGDNAAEVTKNEQALGALRDRCGRTMNAFESIRAAHEQAIQLNQDGYPERAEVLLNEIKDTLDMLKGGG